MGNRVGVIFHEDWQEYSPLMYSHYGANSIPFQLKRFLEEYYDYNNIDDCRDGHIYNSCHMMVGFLQYIGKDIHVRIENLSDSQIAILANNHEYQNCFDGGCWIIDVSAKNYGNTISDSEYILENDNLFLNELKREYDF